MAQAGCETCHGPSNAHVRTPKKNEADVVFAEDGPTPVEARNRVCLDCHEGGAQMHWSASAHEFAGTGCASCHTIHALDDPVRVKQTQRDICFECHKVVRAQMHKRSHHPVVESQIACSDCHDPHGSLSEAQMARATVNDTCYRCHADKRGPFLWEHAPVREDCTICHRPHGSTQPALLKTRGPWLCQECHSAEFHPSEVYDGTDVRPGSFDQHTILKNCLNCHPKVHGSNHPAGARLTR